MAKEMIGTCLSELVALDSNSVCASPSKQPWGARNGHENGPTRYEWQAWVIEYSFLLPLSPLKRTSLTSCPAPCL